MQIYIFIFTVNKSKNSFIFELNIVKSYNTASLCITLQEISFKKAFLKRERHIIGSFYAMRNLAKFNQ